jgi:hypothetical protein
MLVLVLILVIAVVLLISIDKVSGTHTTDARRRKTADDRILNRFLHRRRPKP